MKELGDIKVHNMLDTIIETVQFLSQSFNMGRQSIKPVVRKKELLNNPTGVLYISNQQSSEMLELKS